MSLLCLASLSVYGAQSVRTSILQTDIVPYLESQDTSNRLTSVNDVLVTTQAELVNTQEQLSQADSLLESTQEELSMCDSVVDEAELLISNAAIPEASAIDYQLAELFNFSPYACQNPDDPYACQNPDDPLVQRITKGLIPYLQAALAKLGELSKITQIACGNSHTVILTQIGKVYATGDNSKGQLGIGITGGTRNTLTAMVGAPS